MFEYLPMPDQKHIFVATYDIPEKTAERWERASLATSAFEYANPISQADVIRGMETHSKAFDEVWRIAGKDLMDNGFDERKLHTLNYIIARAGSGDGKRKIHVGYETSEWEVEGVPDEA